MLLIHTNLSMAAVTCSSTVLIQEKKVRFMLKNDGSNTFKLGNIAKREYHFTSVLFPALNSMQKYKGDFESLLQ